MWKRYDAVRLYNVHMQKKYVCECHICICEKDNFVHAVTENIPPLPSTALNWTERREKRAFAAG